MNVTATQLRNWSDAGLISCIRKNTVRYFDESEYEKIQTIKKVLSQPKATLEDARIALLGENALQVLEEEKQVLTTEQMMAAALEKALSGNFMEIFETMGQTFREMQQKLEAVEAENAAIKQQLAKLDDITSHEEQMNEKLTHFETQFSSHEEEMKAQLAQLMHENENLKQHIDSRIDERDKKLMETLRGIQERAEQETKQKKKRFFGLFS